MTSKVKLDRRVFPTPGQKFELILNRADVTEKHQSALLPYQFCGWLFHPTIVGRNEMP
jgi:hypothetical protein